MRLILRDARSHYAWTDKPIPDGMLEELYDITINGPTSMNTLPARFTFVYSPEGKAKLAKSLKPQNVAKMMGAPVTVIISHDMDFWKLLPDLFPHEDRRHLFDGKPEYCADTAFRNGTMQGAYFMIAARALGLGVGWVSILDPDQLCRDLDTPDDWQLVAYLCVGWPEEDSLSPELEHLGWETRRGTLPVEVR